MRYSQKHWFDCFSASPLKLGKICGTFSITRGYLTTEYWFSVHNKVPDNLFQRALNWFIFLLLALLTLPLGSRSTIRSFFCWENNFLVFDLRLCQKKACFMNYSLYIWGSFKKEPRKGFECWGHGSRLRILLKQQ